MASEGNAAVVALVAVAAATAAAAACHGLPGVTTACALLCVWGVWRSGPPQPSRRIETSPPQEQLDAVSRMRRDTVLIDSIPVPLMAMDGKGRLRALNRASRHLFNVDDAIAEGEGGLHRDILAAVPGVQRVVEVGFSSRAFVMSVSDVSSVDGPQRLVTLLDIHAETQKAEAAALKGMVETISHEIMNALSTISSLSDTVYRSLSEGSGADPGVLDASAIVAQRAEGLGRFVEAYRDFARTPEPILGQVSLNAVLDEAALAFRPRIGCRLSLIRSDPDVIFSGDSQQLQQAIAALLTNAAESGEEEAEVEIVLEGGLSPDGRPFIAVVDSGCGIAAGGADIFRPFYTTKLDGHGVGLGIVRQIARAHGGDVSASARADGCAGARFVIDL